jgi:hypothetical protein
VKELSCAIKGDCPQVRREGDDRCEVFKNDHRRRFKKIMGDVDIYTEFEVKVPNILLGTVGFLLRRDGRYSFIDFIVFEQIYQSIRTSHVMSRA